MWLLRIPGRSPQTPACLANSERLLPVLQRVAETTNDAFLAENDHGIEQGRSHGLANNGHAGGVDEQARLDACIFGDFTCSMIARIVIPLGKTGERVREIL